jgi:hypothetical protein
MGFFTIKEFSFQMNYQTNNMDVNLYEVDPGKNDPYP